MIDWLYVAAGLALLVLAGNLLVAGASSLALRLGIAVLIVGLTVVAFGTSAPELIVSLRAALDGQTDLALGNIVGSNIANILGIVGITGLIHPLPVPQAFFALDLWVMLGASLVIAPFILWRLHIGRVAGAGLVGLYAAYSAVLVV